MIHPEQLKWRLRKAVRRYPGAEITDRQPPGAADAFIAEIKRGRATHIFVLSGQEIRAWADKLDDLISGRLSTTMMRT